MSKRPAPSIQLLAGLGAPGDAHPGFPVVPGQMGENVVTRGLDRPAARHPAGAGRGCGGRGDGPAHPCAQLGDLHPGLMGAVLDRNPAGRLIRRAGVMAVIVTGGVIRPGDGVLAEPPALLHLPLERV